MAGVKVPSPTNRPGARPASPFSRVEEVHAGLIKRLAVLKPYRILYIADAQDLEERAERLQQVLGAAMSAPSSSTSATSPQAGRSTRKTSWAWSPIWLATLPGRSPMRRMTSQRGGCDERHRIPTRLSCGAVCRCGLRGGLLHLPRAIRDRRTPTRSAVREVGGGDRFGEAWIADLPVLAGKVDTRDHHPMPEAHRISSNFSRNT
jgi:hypothetical protein